MTNATPPPSPAVDNAFLALLLALSAEARKPVADVDRIEAFEARVGGLRALWLRGETPDASCMEEQS